MKKISAITAVVLSLFVVLYFFGTVHANRADTAPTATYPCDETITDIHPIAFSFDMGSYSSVDLKIFHNGSLVRQKLGVSSSPVSESNLDGVGGGPSGTLDNHLTYTWRVQGTSGEKLVSSTCTFTITR